jgi:DNA-binding Xre family transcriptional regulator
MKTRRRENYMAMSERIRILLVKRNNISESELARRLNISPQNLYSKMKRDNFSEQELEKIATALNCDFNISFTLRDTGETI